MKYPYIASDLDGTIVTTKDNSILESTVESIKKYQKVSNNNFFLCTGRSWGMMKKFVNALNITKPCVASNGATIIDPIKNKVLFIDEVKKEAVLFFIDYCEKFDIEMMFHTPLSIISLETNRKSITFLEACKNLKDKDKPSFILYKTYPEIKKDYLENKFQVIKMLINLEKDVDKNIVEKLEKLAIGFNLSYILTLVDDLNLFDIMPSNTTKASGLAKLAEILKINVKDIIACGDNHNDKEMIEQSNFGVVVGNGVIELKKIAQEVVKPMNENGIGLFVEKLIKDYE